MTKRASLVAIGMIVLAAGGMGCKKLKEKVKEAAGNAAVSGAGALVGGGSGAAYFTDPSSIPEKFKQAIGGPVRVLEMSVYDGYVMAQIQDPKVPLNVDAYELRGGVERTGPVKFMSKQPTEKDLKAATFDIGEAAFAKIPEMVKDAMTQLGIDKGKVSHIMLKRQLPFSRDVSWRIYVSGERRDGSVEYKADGSLKKVWK